jgi:hypothetical protein
VTSIHSILNAINIDDAKTMQNSARFKYFRCSILNSDAQSQDQNSKSASEYSSGHPGSVILAQDLKRKITPDHQIYSRNKVATPLARSWMRGTSETKQSLGSDSQVPIGRL